MTTINSTALWGFPIHSELHTRAQQVLQQIHEADERRAAELNAAAADVVIGLTKHGLEHYYHKPTEIVPLSPGIKKTADTGIKAVMGGINLVIKQFFKKRSADELKDLSLYLDSMLWVHPDKGEPHLVFHVHAELHQRAIQLIQRVRTESSSEAYIDEVVDTLCEVVSLSVTHYYEHPTNKVSLGRVTKKTADVSISGVEKGIRKLIDKLLREVRHEQMVMLSFHLETMLHAKEH